MGKDTDFLQYCLHDDKPLPASVGRIDWMKMIDVSGSQGISGVIYTGIEKGKKELQMPLGVLMEWVGFVQQIENQNKFVNRMCVKVFNELRAAGFECVLLKGQGNALMYPRPLLRVSGDIDILVTNKSRQAITSYVKERKNVTGHHLPAFGIRGRRLRHRDTLHALFAEQPPLPPTAEQGTHGDGRRRRTNGRAA